ncbi:twin-arginine translocase subunit TatC [Collinsella intestinalis]|uniref:twin-arginine translocase subunit TatC n=1 Tax=Collinsella intestinalis TaxID=147207 RepID=UPI0025A3DE50|nr:twin-arginine translocase subunit TatC [Collinsella intestinalis]MDM8164113.1 twin-arginine translocase subunit TatC [Collinsella intestinalis]
MPIGPARMPLMDHLGELRRRLTIVVVTLVVTTLVMYFASSTVIDLLTDPIKPFVGDQFYIGSALGGFTTRFTIGFRTALVMCSPMIVWQVLAFFLPALKPNERKWVVPTVLAATALFFVGMIFCYFFIVPPAFEWLTGEVAAIANPLAMLDDYIGTEMLLMIGFGVAFELPLIVFYLAVFHIVPYASFRASWRVIYVVLAVVAACITPDASPVTMLLMFAVLISLYEIALAVTRFAIVAREGKAGLKKRSVSLFADDDE